MGEEKKGSKLVIKDLSKQFDDKKVLKKIDLTIEHGEFIAIVGRSGCGKSTLLRLVAGLEQPTSGDIFLNDEKVKSINCDTRFLFQEDRLLPWKKVLENVQICTLNKDKEIAINALREVGLEDRGTEWPSVLSGGQKQRVALARALAGNPRLLLFDEPLGALDALTRIEMQQLIEKLWLEQQFTSILVTHDVSEAVALADRVILIDEGEIVMDTQITLDRPRERDNDFVYFEKRILERVMKKTKEPLGKADFSI